MYASGSAGIEGRRVLEPPMPNWLLEGVPGDMSPSSMCEMDKLRDFMLFKLADEKLLRSVGRVKAGEAEREASCSWKKPRGNGGASSSSGPAGPGDGVALDEKAPIKRLGPADRACRC